MLLLNKEAFTIFSKGKSVAPLRINIPVKEQESFMLFMPGYVSDLECEGLKIVSVFPRNIEKNKPVTPATVMLMDETTGEVSSILDGTYITQLRTGDIVGRGSDDIIAFKTVGIGVQDVVTAKRIYDKAITNKIGIEWN